MLTRFDTAERIYGYHPVLNALRSGRAERVILVKQSPMYADLLRYAAKERFVFWTKKQFSEHLGKAAHQGIAADCRPLSICGEKEIKAEAQLHIKEASMLAAAAQPKANMPPNKNYPLYMMLDGVTDPQNFGACLRSAMAFGCLGVIFSKEHSAALNAACCKASAGMIEWIRLMRVANLARVLTGLQEQGYWAFVADNRAGDDLAAHDYACPLVLILGAEGGGVRASLKQQADLRGRIPITPPAASLNVSVAAAICLYAIRYHQARKLLVV